MSKHPPLESLMADKATVKPTAAAKPPVDRGPKGLTIKLDGARYLRLRQLAMDEDRTHQNIMVAAFDYYMASIGR